MADTTEVATPAEDSGTAPPTSPRHPSNRLNQALAWVGIVAGGLFIVAGIFLSGFFLNWSEHAHMQMGMGHAPMAHESKDCCADMKPGETKPSDMKPAGMKPGVMGPDMMMQQPAR